MNRIWLLAITATAGVAAAALAQPVGFLTEQQRLASYCAGVSEARMRQLETFIKSECASSQRRECREATDNLDKQKVMDRRLWDFLKEEIYNNKDQGKNERKWSITVMSRGSDDWTSCQRLPVNQRGDTLPCREANGCLIDTRFRFLPF
jgi:hypothetical protein